MNFLNSNILAAFVTGVAGPLLIFFVSYLVAKKKSKKKDTLVETLYSSNIISNKLEDILQQTKADRIFISQFHNGGNFYPTGKSIQKFSIIYEVVNIGAESIQHKLSNIPVSLFSKSINQLLENDMILIPDYKNPITPTYGLKYVAEENDCKSSYIFAIRDFNGKFIAMLSLDFTKGKKQLDDACINELLVKSASIGGVLCNFLRK